MAENQVAHVFVAKYYTILKTNDLQVGIEVKMELAHSSSVHSIHSIQDGVGKESNQPNVDICTRIEQVEDWRRRNDIIYRLLTNSDSSELYYCIEGLTNTECREGANVGLLPSKYPALMCNPRATKTMQSVLDHRNVSNMDAEQRITCHYLLLVALVMEAEFVTYVSKQSYNRGLLQFYINNVLKTMVTNLLVGSMPTTNTGGRRLYDFVYTARAAYMMHCIPKPPDNVGPAFALGAGPQMLPQSGLVHPQTGQPQCTLAAPTAQAPP